MTLAVLGVVALATLWFVTSRVRRRRAPAPKKVRPGTLLLEANAWERCSVDGVREPWARYTTEPVRGFGGVPAGRHRVVADTPAGEATLDFVLFPGELLAFRLDSDHGRFEPIDVDEAARSALLDGAGATGPSMPAWLVHYRATMGLASSRSGALPPDAEETLARVRARVARLASRAEDGSMGAQSDLIADARAAGEALVGIALSDEDLRHVAAPARETAARQLERGDAPAALRVAMVGLAVLPGMPQLAALAGCALAETGQAEDALAALDAALARDPWLDADLLARAMRLRGELRARLGLSVTI
ncbi:MAG: hypothetical protein KC657_33385 [Myxococcales bacterium]|nr:hypothetical protein [Myxococcales bacterium]